MRSNTSRVWPVIWPTIIKFCFIGPYGAANAAKESYIESNSRKSTFEASRYCLYRANSCWTSGGHRSCRRRKKRNQSDSPDRYDVRLPGRPPQETSKQNKFERVPCGHSAAASRAPHPFGDCVTATAAENDACRLITAAIKGCQLARQSTEFNLTLIYIIIIATRRSDSFYSRAVFAIVSGSDGRTETLLEPAK